MQYITGNTSRRFAWFCFIMIVFALPLISCAKKPEQALIGKWQRESGGELIEFMKTGAFQGTLIWDMTMTPLDVSGTFVIKGDTVELTIEKPDKLTPMRWKVSFSGSDELTIVIQQGGTLKLDGSTIKYRRFKQS